MNFSRTFHDEKNGLTWVTQVQLGAPAAQVAAGAEHSCARLMDGTLADKPLAWKVGVTVGRNCMALRNLTIPIFSD